MTVCEAPEWVQYLVLGLAVFPHVRAFVPSKYQGAVGAALKVADVVAGNYRACRNVKDEQDRVTPKPK